MDACTELCKDFRGFGMVEHSSQCHQNELDQRERNWDLQSHVRDRHAGTGTYVI